MSAMSKGVQGSCMAVLKVLLLSLFIGTNVAVQLAGISDHLQIKLSALQEGSDEALFSDPLMASGHSESSEESPFHRMHVHGNFHVHDFFLPSLFQISTASYVTQLEQFWVYRWLPYDYIGSVFRPPSKLSFV